MAQPGGSYIEHCHRLLLAKRGRLAHPSPMRNRPVVLSALGVGLGLVLAHPGRAAETDPAETPGVTSDAQCAIAAAAIRVKLAASSGMTLAYSADLPDESGVTEGAWTPRMFVPFLREFDSRRQVSAIPVCAALRAELEAAGARVVKGKALDDGKWGTSLAERTAVLRVTLPILSADGTRALVRVETVCGSGCGSGDTYQFIRDAGAWKQNAIRVEWSGTAVFYEDGRQIPYGR